MVGPTELESVTSCVSSRRSNQLSYGPVKKHKTYRWELLKNLDNVAASKRFADYTFISINLLGVC
jgi:hypothetical protein